MNRIERSFTLGPEAKIRYLDGEFQILRNGTHVRCAVTGEPIRIEDLKYWSVAYQEPYLNAEVSFRRFLERRNERPGHGW
jgi:hypothetical protein